MALPDDSDVFELIEALARRIEAFERALRQMRRALDEEGIGGSMDVDELDDDEGDS